MSKAQKNTGKNAKFYKPVRDVTEIRSGYLYKSPPTRRMKAEKSWKRRFFVLFEISQNEHQLKYFRSAEERDSPLGGIDLSNISLLYVNPQQHQRWGWVPGKFSCSPSCVLCIKAVNRDYFLVGENSEQVDGWFSDLFDALKNRPHKCMSSEEGEDFSKRPASEPVNPNYDYPRSYSTETQACENDSTSGNTVESLYETMREVVPGEVAEAAADIEVEWVTGSLMRSVTQAFDKLKTQITPLPPFNEETNDEDREETHPSDFSSSSSDNGATSPMEMLESRNVHTLEQQSSTESLDHIIPEERDIEVKQADLKKHLTLTEVDGKPSVCGWTGQPQTVCLFHMGDHILAINDLHIDSVKEFNMYISKSLKNEVKLTILRLPGCSPLHSPNCVCSNLQETDQ
ncbi:pleckstrin homology domain-containing family S member 1 isoform X2 [Scophthalmus maximus]|uniref:pleckstrin homology domain-containing family S member 1 isoform X2 n=1 Tax=Scophthalmus maximus TaxID=52904 RepID=UPI0015E095D7|nr:pleckstrin homology domain-containing family S member 1 isoform X2 [Scophthalmus maximus]